MTTITYAAPDTRFEMPDAKQCAALLAIVEAAHPEWRIKIDIYEFKLALIALAGMWRLDAPSTQHGFEHFLDHANLALQERHIGTVNAPTFLAAVIAEQIPRRTRDASVGQMAEFALSVYSGLPHRNAWRGLLRGDALRPPLPAREAYRRAAVPSNVKIFQEDRAGLMREVDGGSYDMWRQ
jgi:hypothetical protein